MEPNFYAEYDQHERSHWWFRWRFNLIRTLVCNGSGNERSRVLDAGCGTGAMVQHLLDVCAPVGIDIAPQAVSIASHHGIPGIVRGSLDCMPFEPGTFDTVLVLDVIEHIDDDAAVLRNLHAVLRPGGHLILTVPAFRFLWSEHDDVNHHRRRYTAGQVERLIEEAGFEVQRVTYCNALLFLPVLIMRLTLRLRRRLEHLRANTARPLRSDLCAYPGPVNEALFRLLSAETKLLIRADLPFGTSILALADRPLEA